MKRRFDMGSAVNQESEQSEWVVLNDQYDMPMLQKKPREEADKAENALRQETRLMEIVKALPRGEEKESTLQHISDLLTDGVDPSARRYILSQFAARKNYLSPLHHSTEKGLHRLTELLLKFGANPSAPDRLRVTPLHRAAREGSERCLQLLLGHGAEVNAQVRPYVHVAEEGCMFEVGSTALHQAARGDHVKCVKLLLNFGADCNLTDDEHQTPLHLACKEGLPECVLTLIHTAQAYGLTILSIPTTNNNTALHECLLHGAKMTKCVRELVLMGADVSFPNIMTETPIHVAIRKKWSREIMDLLILEGHGMDFDRSKLTTKQKLREINDPTSNIEMSVMGPPLLHVLYPRLHSACQHEWEQMCGHCRLYHTPKIYTDEKDSLAVFFVQMGASRQSLQHLLWWELNRQAPWGALLDTLLNAFATPPSLPHLERRFSIVSKIKFVEYVNKANEVQQYPRYRYSLLDKDVEPNCLFRRSSTLTQTPAGPPCGVVDEKKEEYAKRCSQVPSLAHLSRMAVRCHLQADVRNVLSFSIPDTVKKYILLGYEGSVSKPREQLHNRGGGGS